MFGGAIKGPAARLSQSWCGRLYRQRSLVAQRVNWCQHAWQPQSATGSRIGSEEGANFL